MRAIILSSVNSIQHLLPWLNDKLDIAAIVLMDMPYGTGTVSVWGEQCTVYSYDYLRECIENIYYDYLLFDIPRYTGIDRIAMEHLDAWDFPGEKLFHTRIVHTPFLTNETFLFSYIRPRMSEYKILFNGSSYARISTYVSDYKLPALNLAHDGQDLYYSYRYLEKLTDMEGCSLRYSVIDVSPWRFHHDESRTRTLVDNCMSFHLPLYYLLFGDIHHLQMDEADIGAIFSPEHYDVSKIYVPDFSPVNLFNFGLVLAPSIGVSDRMRVYDDTDSWAVKRYPVTVRENKEIFRKYLRRCVDNSILPIVVYYPVTSAYRRLFSKQLTDEMYSIVYDTQKDIPFHFLDKSSFDIMTDSDFHDSAHLNISGARKMSSFLNDYIMKIHDRTVVNTTSGILD